MNTEVMKNRVSVIIFSFSFEKLQFFILENENGDLPTKFIDTPIDPIEVVKGLIEEYVDTSSDFMRIDLHGVSLYKEDVLILYGVVLPEVVALTSSRKGIWLSVNDIKGKDYAELVEKFIREEGSGSFQRATGLL